jgi:hypothetical protein
VGYTVGISDGWSEVHAVLFMTGVMLASIAAVRWAWRATDASSSRWRTSDPE